jgi:flagellar biosynthesis component FlhA
MLNITDVIKDLRIKNIGFIIENIHSLSTIKALYQKIDENTYVLYEPRDIQYLKIVSDTLSRYYPDSRQVQSLIHDTRNELDRFYSQQLESIAENTPGIVLNPTLEDYLRTEGVSFIA